MKTFLVLFVLVGVLGVVVLQFNSIIADREEQSLLARVDRLEAVTGITTATLAKSAPFVRVSHQFPEPWLEDSKTTVATSVLDRKVELPDSSGTASDLGWWPVTGRMFAPVATGQLVVHVTRFGKVGGERWAIVSPAAVIHAESMAAMGELRTYEQSKYSRRFEAHVTGITMISSGFAQTYLIADDFRHL